MIKLIAIGNLGGDATINEVNGKKVINFSVAHSEKFKDQAGNEINKSVWINCGYWTDKISICQYLLKGTKVYVEGQPDVKMYRANDGSNRANIVLRVQSIQLLGSKQSENTVSRAANAPLAGEPEFQPIHGSDITEPIDDLPF